MRVAILGVGGLGRTLASELRANRRVTSLLLTDQFGERARVLTGIPGRVSIEAAQLNVENHVALRKALAGADIVVNTTLPRYNLRIMDAALEVGANYLDIASAGSPEPGATPGVFSLPRSRRDPTHVSHRARGGGDPSALPREADRAGGLQTRAPSGRRPRARLPRPARFAFRLPHDPRRQSDGLLPTGPPRRVPGTLRARPPAARGDRPDGGGRRDARWRAGRATRGRHDAAGGCEPASVHDRRQLSQCGRGGHRRRDDRGPGDARPRRPSSRGLGPRARLRRVGGPRTPDGVVRSADWQVSVRFDASGRIAEREVVPGLPHGVREIDEDVLDLCVVLEAVHGEVFPEPALL